MHKTIQSLAVTAIVATLSVFTSCKYSCIKGSGHEVTENHKVSNFDKIDVSGGFRVVLHQDSSLNVDLTADDNLQKNVIIRVDGSKLRIYNKRNTCTSRAMVLNIGVRNLNEITTIGTVDLQVQGKLNVQDIALNFSGASTVNMNLNAANVHTEGSGATEIHLSGQATSHKIDLSGSGRLYAFDFVTGTYNIITSGASYCEVNVLKTIKVNSSGAAEIRYKGNPTSVDNEKSGAATIIKVNL